MTDQKTAKPEAKLGFDELKHALRGEWCTDLTTRALYATDASIYEQLPAAVAIPACEEDIEKLIVFANRDKIGLIPRTAGTSLAGQVVGDGIVVDVSRHFTKIIEINQQEAWVRVQPGVIRDDLNRTLAEHGLYFAPETSTANRAMIGGMVGNNSSGANSIVYSDTRSHVIELTGFMSDGAKVTFGPVSPLEFESASREASLLGSAYRCVSQILSDNDNRTEILNQFPKPSIHRRNTGYALDSLLDARPFGSDDLFNFCSLLTGSEGTLFFTTEAKLNCVPIPESRGSLVCAHFDSIGAALQANIIAGQYNPSRCELMDSYIIAGIRNNRSNEAGIGFIVGEPAAVLMIDFDDEQHPRVADNLVKALQAKQLGFDFPILQGSAATEAWCSRKAALGGLKNLDDEKTAITLIEDAAIDVADLPNFVAEVTELLHNTFDTQFVVYGHAGAGELHLRPWLDLRHPKFKETIRAIATEFAKIVKNYRGALSGEHGSGRSRSELIESMVGHHCYEMMRQIKTAFDPNNIFNPGKIVDPDHLDSQLRIVEPAATLSTQFQFPAGGILQAASRCSGSGDCRKSPLAGGTMCPSYQATRNERDSTRARANLLRQSLSGNTTERVSDHEVRDILELCLSCKACKVECPSNVDMAQIKAEFLHQYQTQHGTPIRSRMLANFEMWCERIRRLGGLGRFAARNSITSGAIKKLLGVHANRKLPCIEQQSLRSWFAQRKQEDRSNVRRGRVLLFCDEFTNQIDVGVGQATIELLELLGYEVSLLDNVESGRSAISLGMLDVARTFVQQNVTMLAPLAAAGHSIIGIEPSAILTLRDEYPDLVGDEFKQQAQILSKSVQTIDEFIALKIDHGEIAPEQFVDDKVDIRLHAHCHQKAICGTTSSMQILSLPVNSQVHEISAGCCGMAGFFGYDRHKFDLSQQIGELLLFPAIRSMPEATIFAATGTSCRQQILDATGVTATHPIQVLRKLIRTK